MVNYLVDGVKPTPTAGELADAVRRHIPNAEINFKPDPNIQPHMNDFRSMDDSKAREEWGWQPTHNLDRIIEDFLAAMNAAS